EEREIIDCLLALRAIRDITDDVAVAGFLKSPFVGVRDDTLLALARAANGQSLASALAASLAEPELCRRAALLLTRFAAQRDRVSIHALLQRLLFESGYQASVALHPERGAQAVANLRKLVRTAATTPDLSLGDFLRAVAEQRERNDRIAPERLYRERSDVVTITSVHSAKGLEWPVVFWCDLVRDAHNDNDKLLIARSTFCVKDESLPEDAKDPVYQSLAEELSLERRAEAFRLWYVATTRAQRLLVLSGIALGKPHKATSPAAALREHFPTLGTEQEVTYNSEAGSTYHARVRSCSETPLPLRDIATTPPDLSLAPAAVHAPLGGARLSASQLMTFAHDAGLWWERYVLRCETSQQRSLRFTGSTWVVHGLIVHDVLQRLGDGAEDVGLLLEDAIAERDEDAPIAESPAGLAYRRFLRERVEAAAGSPVWQDVAHAPGARRELAFTRLLADGSAISGAMDVAARSGGTVQILDVKTTTSGGAHLAERYAIQAAVYADAAAAIGGASDVRFTLLTVPAGERVDVPRSVDVSALVARLRVWRSA
ncbi:MAG: PD-(D/E)XK nuclease family protein, partial [Gemmatimonadaceae bacterium]|nr:PD-(D/E)XK nuclease family protein [Gemmatimonadaceae bacterium]